MSSRAQRGTFAFMLFWAAGVSPEVTRMITCTNAGKFYGLIN